MISAVFRHRARDGEDETGAVSVFRARYKDSEVTLNELGAHGGIAQVVAGYARVQKLEVVDAHPPYAHAAIGRPGDDKKLTKGQARALRDSATVRKPAGAL